MEFIEDVIKCSQPLRRESSSADQITTNGRRRLTHSALYFKLDWTTEEGKVKLPSC